MRSFERNTRSPEFPVSFRDLWNELCEVLNDDEANNGRGAVFATLERWVEPSRQTLVTYSDLKRRNTPEDDYSARDWLQNLYALSRVNDRLLRYLHAEETRPWFDKSDYVTFFEGIGFSSFERDQFTPFHHEIVEVAAETTGPPVQVAFSFWPGLMFGEMLFSRSGVAVLAHPEAVDKNTAEQSTLHHAHTRPNRLTSDLSMGWGSNSQWGTDFERSYESETHYFFGCPDVAAQPQKVDLLDGYDYHKNKFFRQGAFETIEKLSIQRCRELLMHRCFVRGGIDIHRFGHDYRPNRFMLRIRKADTLWPLEESLIEPCFTRS